MGFSLGELFVQVDAQTSGMLKGFAASTRTVEKFAKDVKRAANDVAQVGAALTAIAGGALALAATVDGPTKKAMEGMKQATTGLAVEVSRTLMPAVQSVTQSIRDMADWFAGLSPGTKQMISDFAIFAAQAALLGTALSKIAGLVGGLAGGFASLAKAIAGVGVVPILGVALAVGAVLAAVVVLHKAWRENWGGIQQHVRTFLQWFQDNFSGVFGKVGKWLSDLAVRFLDFVDRITSSMQAFFEAMGLDAMAGLAKSAKEMIRTLRDDVEEQGLGGVVSSIIEDMADTGVAAGTAFKKEFNLILKELGIDDLFKSVKGISHSGQKAPNYSTTGESAGSAAGAGAAAGASSSGFPSWASQGISLLGQTARDAADATKGFTKAIEESTGTFGQAMQSGANTIIGAAGDLGSAVGGVIRGFQSGGVWGGIIAIIAEVLIRLEGFQALLGELNAMFQNSLSNIGKHIGGLLAGIGKLFAFITKFADAIEGVIGSVLTPLFDRLGELFSGLANVLEPITTIFSALGKVLKPIFELLGMLANVLTPLAPLFAVIGFVLKLVALVLLGVFWVIGKAINAIQDIFDANAKDAVDTGAMEKQMEDIALSLGEGFDPNAGVAKIEDGSMKVADSLDRAADRIDQSAQAAPFVLAKSFDEWVASQGGALTEKDHADFVRWQTAKGGFSPEQIEDLWKETLAKQPSMEGYQQYLETLPGYINPLEAGLSDLASTVEEVNAAMSNVPSWFKVNEARFNAANDGSLPMHSLSDRGQSIVFNIEAIHVSDADPKRFAGVLQREAYRQTGNPYAALAGVPA